MTELLKNTWAQVAALAGVWAVSATVIWQVFERLERVASYELRETTVRWLAGLRSQDREGVTSFRGIWEAIFSGSLLWGRGITAIIMLTVLGEVLGNFVTAYMGGPLWLLDASLGQVAGAIFADFIFTVLAVWKTRALVRQLPIGTSAVQLLTADLALSSLMVIAGLFLATLYMADGDVKLTFKAFPHLFASPTILVSAILWLTLTTVSFVAYLTAGLLVRLSPHRTARKLLRLVDVDKQPFLSIGAMLILILTLIYLPFAAIRMIL